jgi:hypothetical protein
MKMRVQSVAAVTPGLALIPVSVFGCPGAVPPTAQVKNVRMAAGNKADAIFEGKVERVELGWKLKEAQIGDVIPTVATDLNRDGPPASGFVGGIALLSR